MDVICLELICFIPTPPSSPPSPSLSSFPSSGHDLFIHIVVIWLEFYCSECSSSSPFSISHTSNKNEIDWLIKEEISIGSSNQEEEEEEGVVLIGSIINCNVFDLLSSFY